MRIAVVCPYSVSVPGGVQHQVLGLARALRDLGRDAVVVAPVDGPIPEGVLSVGRSVSIATNGSLAPVAPYPAAARRALQILRDGRFDLVHLHEPFAPSITIPVMLRRPAPLVGTFHAAGEQTAYRLFQHPFRLMARRLDARVAISETAAAPVRRYLGGTYEMLFNGIDHTPFDGGHARPQQPPAVLFVGRDDPRKGLGVLLDAFARLPSHVELWVAGPGTDTSRRRAGQRSGGRIRWLGELSEAEKIGRLRAASVVCVPSLQAESFGVVLLEAMAAGAPIVASDLPAYRAVTDGGRAARLVTVGDVAALAEALSQLLDAPDVADELRAAASAVSARYRVQSLAERYCALYERVLDSTSTSSSSPIL